MVRAKLQFNGRSLTFAVPGARCSTSADTLSGLAASTTPPMTASFGDPTLAPPGEQAAVPHCSVHIC